MSIYVNRFLNMPRAQLLSEQPVENLPTAADELRETILSALDQRREWSEVPRLALLYLRLGHSEAKLIDTLTLLPFARIWTSISLQVLEAGFIQAEEWPPTGAERELLYAAICRHLAAHCPTRRISSQSVTVTLRPQKTHRLFATIARRAIARPLPARPHAACGSGLALSLPCELLSFGSLRA